jgi:hypothetical protein
MWKWTHMIAAPSLERATVHDELAAILLIGSAHPLSDINRDYFMV